MSSYQWQNCVSNFREIKKGWLCKISSRISNITSLILREILQSHFFWCHESLKQRVAKVTESNGLNLFLRIWGNSGTRFEAAYYYLDWSSGRAVRCSSLEREGWGSNLGPVKSDIVLPTARNRCKIFSKVWSCVARAQWRGGGPCILTTRFGVIQRV